MAGGACTLIGFGVPSRCIQSDDPNIVSIDALVVEEISGLGVVDYTMPFFDGHTGPPAGALVLQVQVAPRVNLSAAPSTPTWFRITFSSTQQPIQLS